MSEYKGGGVAALERDLYHAQFSLPPLQLQVLIIITTIIIITTHHHCPHHHHQHHPERNHSQYNSTTPILNLMN